MSADARLELTPDEVREADDGYYIECPECGTPTRLIRIVESGRCAGYGSDDVDCEASLSLELVWG